jgi:Xaa-Pro aminopeptidase
MRTLNHTDYMEPKATAAYIRARKDKKVGFVAPANMSAIYYTELIKSLPEVEFVDFTDEIDEIKAVKSEDEMVFIRKTVALQDDLIFAMPTIVRPGIYEYEVRQKLVTILEERGGEEQLISLSSEPRGTRAPHTPCQIQNRKIQRGDNIMIMIEVNGPGGLYGEVGRQWSLGEPSRELLALWEIAKEGQHLTAGLCQPGADPAEILKTYNEFCRSKGVPPEERLFAHGQGYDLVERPSFTPRETMPLKAGMVIAIHPTLINEKAYAYCCDNYYISEKGAERMHKAPQEIIILD